ncbi:hypothetical protein, partial [Helicobacter typhlonius]|uniref:hypothetical protein n=1 Tax=Helicobacter typhlonius TaxID=76936 RepID=UPI002FE02513
MKLHLSPNFQNRKKKENSHHQETIRSQRQHETIENQQLGSIESQQQRLQQPETIERQEMIENQPQLQETIERQQPETIENQQRQQPETIENQQRQQPEVIERQETIENIQMSIALPLAKNRKAKINHNRQTGNQVEQLHVHQKKMIIRIINHRHQSNNRQAEQHVHQKQTTVPINRQNHQFEQPPAHQKRTIIHVTISNRQNRQVEQQHVQKMVQYQYGEQKQ